MTRQQKKTLQRLAKEFGVNKNEFISNYYLYLRVCGRLKVRQFIDLIAYSNSIMLIEEQYKIYYGDYYKKIHNEETTLLKKISLVLDKNYMTGKKLLTLYNYYLKWKDC